MSKEVDVQHSPNMAQEEQPLRTNDYQIGTRWNRDQIKSVDLEARRVFQLYRSGMGAVGTGVYIGKFADRHLVMTAAHVYKSLASCSDEVSFLAVSDEINFLYYCSGWHFFLQESDVLIFEILSPDTGALEALVAPRLEFNALGAYESLRMVSIERLYPEYNFTWQEDKSQDCRVLNNQARELVDVDQISETSEQLRSWSLPVGCDGMHGDSGAPLFNREDALVGILWTGKFPKSDGALSIYPKDPSLLWSEYNYMVPLNKVREELNKIITDKSLDIDSLSILSEIIKN